MPSVLVTGAGRGIGLAICHRMSEAGWTVYATARSESALARLDQLHHVHAVPLDITDRTAIAALRCPGESRHPQPSLRRDRSGRRRSGSTDPALRSIHSRPSGRQRGGTPNGRACGLSTRTGSSTGTPAQRVALEHRKRSVRTSTVTDMNPRRPAHRRAIAQQLHL